MFTSDVTTTISVIPHDDGNSGVQPQPRVVNWFVVSGSWL